MEGKYTNTDCLLHNTKYCSILNMQSCETCTVDCRTEDRANKVKENLDFTLSLMPEEGIGALFSTDKCRLCKGEPNKASWFAFTDIAHPLPKRKKEGVLGIPKTAKAGTLLPVQISCCDKCRRNYMLADYIYPVTVSVFSLAGLVLMSIRSIREPLAAVASVLPVAILVAAVVLGVVLGTVFKKNVLKKAAGETILNIMDVPVLDEMKEKGWFELYPNKGMSKLVFTKKAIRQGMFTGKDE